MYKEITRTESVRHAKDLMTRIWISRRCKISSDVGFKGYPRADVDRKVEKVCKKT